MTTPEQVAPPGGVGTAWNGQAPQPGAVVVDKNQAKRKAPKQAK